MSPTIQTFTYCDSPAKEELLRNFKGKPLDVVRTPAMVIDRSVFAKNCAAMHQRALRDWGVDFRAHLKSHKTAEGTLLQLNTSVGQTHAVIVSTLREAWGIVKAGLTEQGIVRDILYGVPVAMNKLADLSQLWDQVVASSPNQVGVVRVIVDHIAQIEGIEEFEKSHSDDKKSMRKWSVFIKVDAGYKRAGIPVGSDTFAKVVGKAAKSPNVDIHGFYCHAGHAYDSTSFEEATEFLVGEVATVNEAAKAASELLGISSKDTGWVLSVGSTPTAHSVTVGARERLTQALNGKLELHAGNYPLLDLQQLATGEIERSSISQHVLATVVSYYPQRRVNGMDEACIDAGGVAFSKDSGPSGTYGEVVGDSGEVEWCLVKISQEHGTLAQQESRSGRVRRLEVGKRVKIVGQHACLVAAGHPYYYIVDSAIDGGQTIVDVWVPWKGW